MTDTNVTGQILEKTTRTKIISEPPSPPDFWEYMEQLRLPDSEHLMYLYLQRENRNVPYGQYSSHFTARDGHLVPIDDREALEQAIQHRFGGGIWRLILKKGKSRKCETRIFTGETPTLPPPPPDPNEQAIQQNPNNPFTQNLQPAHRDANVDLAAHAIDTISEQEHKSVSVGLDMFKAGTDAMKSALEMRFANAAAPAGPVAALQDALTNALIGRLTRDPMEDFKNMLAVMREVSGGSASGNGNDIARPMEQLRSVFSFVRELGVSSAPAVSTGAEIVRHVATVIPQAMEGVRASMSDWKLGKEAEERTAVLMMQPGGRPGFTSPARPPGPPPAPPPMVAPQPAIAAASGISPSSPYPPPGGAPSTEFIESRIMELIRAPISAEDVAHDVLTFLHTLAGENPPPERQYVAQLASLGETGLVNLFNMRPTLKPATANMPRLLEFIRMFLSYHAEDQAQESKPPN